MARLPMVGVANDCATVGDMLAPGRAAEGVPFLEVDRGGDGNQDTRRDIAHPLAESPSPRRPGRTRGARARSDACSATKPSIGMTCFNPHSPRYSGRQRRTPPHQGGPRWPPL
jgi:hypothetical protein